MQDGDTFPAFELASTDGTTISSADLAGRRYLIFFYSKDNTAGCTKEAVDFSNLRDEFAKAGITILGVSGDSVESHRKFTEKQNLAVNLLSDAGHSLALAAGAYGEKMNYGKTVMGTIRSTFLVGADGKVERAWRNVKATGHAGRVASEILGI